MSKRAPPGTALHIEDVNPESMRGERFHGGGGGEMESDDEVQVKAFKPGSITVGAAVRMSFELER